VDLLEGWGYTVSVAHSKDVHAIAMSKSKTDKIDSRILAKLLQSDFLPRAYVPPKQIREMRELLRHRIWLGQNAAQVKNRVHALLSTNWVTQEFTDLFGKSGRQFLTRIELPELTREVLESLLRQLEAIEQEIEQIQATMARQAVWDEDVRRLMEITGIDFYSAQVIVNEIGDVGRFPSYRELASYAGLVPSVRNSGETVRHGHITKEGNRNLRWILVEAGIKAKENNPKLKKTYNRISRRRGKMIARVATARHLLRIIYYMLRDKTEYHNIDLPLYAEKIERMEDKASLRCMVPKGAKKPQGHPLKPVPAVEFPKEGSFIKDESMEVSRGSFS
ncbi:MAG: IS110 family transposase, partial [Candidatus Thermoplasmatota archaeon]